MIFVYRKWDAFCRELQENGLISKQARDADGSRFIILKHDVETNVRKAYKMAKIEAKYGHRGSYYVQAYLMKNPKNVKLLQEMQAWGHEISYHYDVMDSCKGDLEKAIGEFEANRMVFEKSGFDIVTVCQHGNPLVERNGYTSNRDFFRSDKVRKLYPSISDIMVNYQEQYGVKYDYYSDVGRLFKLIYDPLFNDVVNSDDKNIPFKSMEELLIAVSKNGSSIISTHPHRWCSSSLIYLCKAFLFKVVKGIAKLLYRIPFLRKFMNKYYYLAKKI